MHGGGDGGICPVGDPPDDAGQGGGRGVPSLPLLPSSPSTALLDLPTSMQTGFYDLFYSSPHAACNQAVPLWYIAGRPFTLFNVQEYEMMRMFRVGSLRDVSVVHGWGFGGYF